MITLLKDFRTAARTDSTLATACGTAGPWLTAVPENTPFPYGVLAIVPGFTPQEAFGLKYTDRTMIELRMYGEDVEALTTAHAAADSLFSRKAVAVTGTGNVFTSCQRRYENVCRLPKLNQNARDVYESTLRWLVKVDRTF